MGTGPELGGISSRAARDRGLREVPVLEHLVPVSALAYDWSEGFPPNRRDSSIGREHLPEHLGMGAHDDGISPYLGFS